MVMLQFLPPESAFNTALRNDTPEHELADEAGDPTRAPWSIPETLLAMLIDELRNLQWMYASAHSKSRIPHPEPIPRPGARGRGRKRTLISVADAQRMDPRLRGLTPDEMQKALDRIAGRG